MEHVHIPTSELETVLVTVAPPCPHGPPIAVRIILYHLTMIAQELQINLSRTVVMWFFIALLILAVIFLLLWVAFWGYKKFYSVQYEILTGRDIDEDEPEEEEESRL